MRINKNFIIKTLIYAFIAIIFALFQTNINIDIEALGILNIKPNLIISLVIAACILENERYGAILGFVFGFVLDSGFGTSFVLSGIFYFFAAYLVGALTRTYFKKSLVTMAIAILPVCFVQAIINLFYLIALWDKFNFIDALWKYIAPEFIYTIIFAPFVYLLLKFTAGKISYNKI
jgi:rod shape-determining protein MreD.